MSDVVACFLISGAVLIILAAIAYFFPWSMLPRTRLAAVEQRLEELSNGMGTLEFSVKRNEEHTETAINALKEERSRYVQMQSSTARRS